MLATDWFAKKTYTWHLTAIVIKCQPMGRCPSQVCTCIRALKVFQICSLRVIFLGEDVSDGCKVHEFSLVKLIVKMDTQLGEQMWQLFAYTCNNRPCDAHVCH